MASIRDVARQAEVAIGTVSRVLNGGSHVTDLTRQRVQKAIKELGYKPNPAARALRSNRTHLIALTLPELTNPFYAAIVEGVRQVFEPADFRLVLCSPNSSNNAVPQYIDMLANRYIDGLIVVFDRFSAADNNSIALFRLGRKGFPIVALGPGVASDKPDFDCITSQVPEGLKEAMQHLVEMGHREIAYFGPLKGVVEARLQAYRTALARHKIKIADSLIFRGETTLESGFSRAEELFQRQRRPTAIVAVNDMVAIGAMMALQEHGVSIPEEMSIVGIDDIPLASMVHPTLTTVFQPKEAMGRLAAERLLGRIEKRINSFSAIALSSQLIVRESTGPAPNFRPTTNGQPSAASAQNETMGKRRTLKVEEAAFKDQGNYIQRQRAD
jgi:LacI family transcriptional regulator